MSRPRPDQPFIKGTVNSPAGPVPQISSDLAPDDYLGMIKVRCNIRRMSYTVDPGLYATGQPDRHSRVLVTANYKLSFDLLRNKVSGRDLWILVLDTKGVNVWCAAGKGTFGTDELISRIRTSGLADIIEHRQLILPQLSAPGVAAHRIKKASGFEVVYGPVQSADLPAFLDSGLKATPDMRRKSFPFRERALLIPVEFILALKHASIIILFLFLAGGLGGPGTFWGNAAHYGTAAVLSFGAAFFAGAVLTPLFLPWLPGRAFSVKGLFAGIISLAALHGRIITDPGSGTEWLNLSGQVLMTLPVASYLGMNFTGASTYTSLSGVKKEMKWAVPLQIAGVLTGIILWLVSRFMA